MFLWIVLLVVLALVCVTFTFYDRPWATLGWSVLGGLALAVTSFGILYLLARNRWFPFEPSSQPAKAEDWGAFANALLQLAFFVVIPGLGLFLGYIATLIAIAVLRTRRRQGLISCPDNPKGNLSDPGLD